MLVSAAGLAVVVIVEEDVPVELAKSSVEDVLTIDVGIFVGVVAVFEVETSVVLDAGLSVGVVTLVVVAVMRTVESDAGGSASAVELDDGVAMDEGMSVETAEKDEEGAVDFDASLATVVEVLVVATSGV